MTQPWYPFYWADYISKTYHLTQGQHGAYMLLLCYIYNTGKSIDCRQCYSIAKATLEQERSNVDFVLATFFELEGEFYVSNKAIEIMQDAERKHQRRVYAGAKGGNSKSSNATAMLKQPQPQPQPDSKKESTPQLAQRLAALKSPDSMIQLVAYAKEHGVVCDISGELEQFTQYCLSGKGRYTNHLAAFRNWILKRKVMKNEGFSRNTPDNSSEKQRGANAYAAIIAERNAKADKVLSE